MKNKSDNDVAEMKKSSIPPMDPSSAQQTTMPDKFFFQYVVAFSGTFMLFSSAITFGWTSPTLPILLSENTPIVITPDESSWIVVAMVVGSVFAPLMAAWFMDRFGRKLTLLIGGIPMIIGWLLIAFADSVIWLYISRVLNGLSYGLAYSVTPMYLGEIASDKVRGSISTLVTVMAKGGILYMFAIGPYVSMYTMAWIGLAPPIIFIVTFIWMPESPYYLIGKNNTESATKSLIRLRGHSAVQDELKRMEIIVRKSEENKTSYWELCAKDNIRSLIIALGLVTAQQLCGSQAIIAYSQSIFARVGSPLGASEASIILAVVQLITSIVATSVVDKMGRRPLLLFSITGAALSNTVVCIYFILERHNVDVSNVGMVAIVAIMTFIISYTMGLASVTFAVIAEIFPKNLRAKAGASYTIWAALVSFGVGKLFQVVSDDLGSDYTFGGFAIFSYLFIPFVYFLIPETKGKSLDIILEMMKEGKVK